MTLSRNSDALAPFGNAGQLFTAMVMVTGLAFFLQNYHPVTPSAPWAPRARIVLIDAAARPAPNPEAHMSGAQLMRRWEPLIADAARRFQIPAEWIRNVMRAESGGRTYLNGQAITSNKGAMGLMQVQQQTFADMASKYRLGDNPFDPRDNIHAGAAYLRWLHGRYGYPAMFAAYNAGPGYLEQHLHKGRPLPQETRQYVARITKALGKGGDWLASRSAARLTLTGPNGRKLALDRYKVSGVRAALPGEYGPGVTTVISMGRLSQGVKESADHVLALLTSPKNI